MQNEPKTCLTDGSPVTPDHREIDPASGQQKGVQSAGPKQGTKHEPNGN